MNSLAGAQCATAVHICLARAVREHMTVIRRKSGNEEGGPDGQNS